ncbi:hypothetical protein OTU49_017404, partial [Cherax quadricarinatus]
PKHRQRPISSGTPANRIDTGARPNFSPWVAGSPTLRKRVLPIRGGEGRGGQHSLVDLRAVKVHLNKEGEVPAGATLCYSGAPGIEWQNWKTRISSSRISS